MISHFITFLVTLTNLPIQETLITPFLKSMQYRCLTQKDNEKENHRTLNYSSITGEKV